MKPTPLLFTTSFAVSVLAGWALVGAGPEVDGPAHKPAIHEAIIDGHKLTVSLDRERVPAGESVQVTLAMSDAKTAPARGFDVKVTLVEQSGSMMSRVMPPPREVLSKVIHIGKEPVVLPLELAGAPLPGRRRDQGPNTPVDELAIAGMATQYTVAIEPVKRGKSDDGRGNAAVPVYAYRAEAFRLTIDPPAPAKIGETVDVAVHVKNLSPKALQGISIGLSTSFLSIEDAPPIATLAPGAETVVHLKATRIDAPAEGELLLQAFGWAEYGGTASAWATVDRQSGALARRASEPYLVADSSLIY
jgi:hypothetical protein